MSEMNFMNGITNHADNALREQIMDRCFMMGTMKQASANEYESLVYSFLKAIRISK